MAVEATKVANVATSRHSQRVRRRNRGVLRPIAIADSADTKRLGPLTSGGTVRSRRVSRSWQAANPSTEDSRKTVASAIDT